MHAFGGTPLLPLGATTNAAALRSTPDAPPAASYLTLHHTHPSARKQGPQYEDVNISQPLTAATFDATAQRYDVLIVNFFAPWCPWCQRLAPTWEAVTEDIHNRYPESDGRIRLAKVRGRSV